MNLVDSHYFKKQQNQTSQVYVNKTYNNINSASSHFEKFVGRNGVVPNSHRHYHHHNLHNPLKSMDREEMTMLE